MLSRAKWEGEGREAQSAQYSLSQGCTFIALLEAEVKAKPLFPPFFASAMQR